MFILQYCTNVKAVGFSSNEGKPQGVCNTAALQLPLLCTAVLLDYGLFPTKIEFH